MLFAARPLPAFDREMARCRRVPERVPMPSCGGRPHPGQEIDSTS